MYPFHEIFKENAHWIAEKIAKDPHYFEKLSKGQSPEILYIGCSDSRVTAEDLMGAEPGEIFIHRNIANLVVSTDSNINAVVQYAVEYLHVKHIVVCGHYECGGVKAALNPSDMGQLNNWLQTLRDVYRLHQHELDELNNEKAKFDRLVELNVREQCINIIKIDHVQRAWHRTGYPHIHGWVFNVRDGRLIDLGLNMEEEFASIRSIYDLCPKVAAEEPATAEPIESQHKAAVLAQLSRWSANRLDEYDPALPKLKPKQAEEVQRLAKTLQIESFHYRPDGHGRQTSECTALIDGARLTTEWIYNYDSEQSDWTFAGAFSASGDGCFFGEMDLSIPKKALPTSLSGKTLQAFLYVVMFDHLNAHHNFYHRPSWD